jgi:hypothetical protein
MMAHSSVTAQTALGHSAIVQTMDTYSHLLEHLS